MFWNEAERGYSVETLRFVPSKFKDYRFSTIRLKDLSVGQVSSLSIMGPTNNLSKLVDIYSSCFLNIDIDKQTNLLYIDYLTILHYINHLTFGIYNNSFMYDCPCGSKHRITYTLYDMNFTEPVKKYSKHKAEYKGAKFTLRPFTVGSMMELIEFGLEESEPAYIASSLDTIDGKKLPEGIVERLEAIEDKSFGFSQFVVKELLELYPTTSVVSLPTTCGQQVEFIPDLNLKGLPRFTKQ